MNDQAQTQPARVEPTVPLLRYQRDDIDSDDRFRWNCWARQTGKSFTKSLRRILRGLERRRTQIFLSAGERQSRELIYKARQHCQRLRIPFDDFGGGFFSDLTFRRLEVALPAGVRVIALPANPDTARGFTGDVLLDEFAMHAHDREIWAAMFPTVLHSDGELDIASTPKGKGNLFYELGDNPRFATSRLTLPEAIEAGLRVDAEEMRRAMGDDTLYRQEFLCEFVDESTAFITYDQIAACTDPGLTLCDSPVSLARESGELFVGVDIGRRRDLTVVWVIARRGEGFVTRALFELDAAPFRRQFALLCDLLKNRNVRRCCIDAGGLGMQLAEQAVEKFGGHRVEAVRFSAALKSQIAAALRITVEAGRITIPDDDRITKDWHSLQRTVTAGGHLKLDAPRRDGSHADRFWAAALALHAADLDVGPVESMSVQPLHFAREGSW